MANGELFNIGNGILFYLEKKYRFSFFPALAFFGKTAYIETKFTGIESNRIKMFENIIVDETGLIKAAAAFGCAMQN